MKTLRFATFIVAIFSLTILARGHPASKPVKPRIAPTSNLISKIISGDDDVTTAASRLKICTLCQSAITVLQTIVATGISEEDVINDLVLTCVQLKLYTEPVCRGTLESFVGEAMYILNNTQTKSDEICSLLTKNSCGDVYSDAHNWTVQFPVGDKPPVYEPTVVEGKPRLKVLHISDIHFDPGYVVGSNAECAEPTCCQESSGQPADDLAKAGKWGDYRNCDTPEATLDHMLEHIVKTHKDIDFVYWTGDLPPHDIWKQSKEGNLYVINETIVKVFNAFPEIPVFPALGNHEAFPVNSYSGPDAPDKWSMDWLYNELDTLWQKWLPPSISNTVRLGAYYSSMVKDKLKVISLNMNYCLSGNFWLVMNSTDVAQEIEWLVKELQHAEENNIKVHILGHVPPGSDDCIKKWSENYYKIINRYENTVTSQYFGHTHKDSYQLFYDQTNQTRPINVAYIGPSLTPYSFLNPGYRIYHIDGDHEDSTWTVVEHENWYMDLDEANQLDAPKWRQLYSTNDYNMKNLLPAGWDDFLNRMMKNQTLFDMYTKNHLKNSPVWEPCVEDSCRYSYFCDIRTGKSYSEVEMCADLKKK